MSVLPLPNTPIPGVLLQSSERPRLICPRLPQPAEEHGRSARRGKQVLFGGTKSPLAVAPRRLVTCHPITAPPHPEFLGTLIAQGRGKHRFADKINQKYEADVFSTFLEHLFQVSGLKGTMCLISPRQT